MGLPAFTIHTIVSRSKPFFVSRFKSPRIRTWGPTLSGIAAVPVLPYMFDEPVEKAVDALWELAERRAGIVKQGGENAKKL